MLRWGGSDAWLGAAQQPGTEEVCGPAQAAERGRAVQVPPPLHIYPRLQHLCSQAPSKKHSQGKQNARKEP